MHVPEPNAKPQTTAPFLKLWLPSFLIFISYGLNVFGLNWSIARSPGGGGLLGVTVGLSSMASTVTVVILAGLIDRMSRSGFLLRIQGILALAFAALAVSYLGGSSAVAFVMLSAATYLLIESTNALYQAGLETTAADLAPSAWPSSRTASLLQLQAQVARLAAPLLGGTLVALGLLWLLPVLGGLAVLITSMLLWLWRDVVRDTQPAIQTENAGGIRPDMILRNTWSDAKVGVVWIKEQPTLLFMLAIGIAGNLIVFPFFSLLPAFLTEMGFGNDAILYGRISSVYGAGMLTTTALFVPYAKKIKHPERVVGVAALLICAVLGLMSTLRSPWSLILSSGLVGVLFMVLVAVAGGTWLDLTPSSVRVRVFSLRRLVTFASIPLGSSLMGLGGAAMGYTAFLWVLLGVAVAMILFTWLFFRRGQHSAQGVSAR